MGYCIEHEEGEILIKEENMDKVLKVLSDFFSNGGKLGWVNGFDIDEMNSDDPLSIEDIWDDLRYGIDLDDGYYHINSFYGEKYGDDDTLFSLIAPYCEDGYLQFCGDDGEHFRFIIKDGKFEEKYAKILWD